MLKTDTHSVVSRVIIWKTANAPGGNLLKAKRKLHPQLEDITAFLDRFYEVCQEEKDSLKLIVEDVIGNQITHFKALHLGNCQLAAFHAKSHLAAMANTYQNRKIVFDKFIYECWKSAKEYEIYVKELKG